MDTALDMKSVSGYGNLSEQQIDLMNEMKAAVNAVGDVLAKFKSLPELDQRCISIACTKAQESSMWACRAVTKPANFA